MIYVVFYLFLLLQSLAQGHFQFQPDFVTYILVLYTKGKVVLDIVFLLMNNTHHPMILSFILGGKARFVQQWSVDHVVLTTPS